MTSRQSIRTWSELWPLCNHCYIGLLIAVRVDLVHGYWAMETPRPVFKARTEHVCQKLSASSLLVNLLFDLLLSVVLIASDMQTDRHSGSKLSLPDVGTCFSSKGIVGLFHFHAWRGCHLPCYCIFSCFMFFLCNGVSDIEESLFYLRGLYLIARTFSIWKLSFSFFLFIAKKSIFTQL